MKQKYIILLTILITLVIVVGGFFAWQYELSRNKTTYEEGYDSGKLEGLLYTQQTGNILFNVNGNLTELKMPEEWKLQIQQYLNQIGGQE